MSRTQHFVVLSPEDRSYLQELLRRGVSSAQAQRRARILLKADRAARGPRLTDAQIAAAVDVAPRTVARVRAAWAATGRACLTRPPQPKVPKLDGAAEARLIALACSAPPDGRVAWSLRLLSSRAVELRIAGALSHETVRRTLKKTRSNPGGPSAS